MTIDRAVSGGDDRFLAEYIRSEFLPQLTPDLLTFLRRTSVLEHLTAPVCDAVLERTGSGRVLASLDRMPLLLAPLDRHGEAYRCHPLFRDLLARELSENEPELAAELNRRAADWFEAHGDLEAALPHAEGSADIDRMARIVAAIALPAYYRGRIDDVEELAREVRRDGSSSATRRSPSREAGCTRSADDRPRPSAGSPPPSAAADGEASVEPAISLLHAALCRDGVDQMCVDIELALAGLPRPARGVPRRCCCSAARSCSVGRTPSPTRFSPGPRSRPSG